MNKISFKAAPALPKEEKELCLSYEARAVVDASFTGVLSFKTQGAMTDIRLTLSSVELPDMDVSAITINGEEEKSRICASPAELYSVGYIPPHICESLPANSEVVVRVVNCGQRDTEVVGRLSGKPF